MGLVQGRSRSLPVSYRAVLTSSAIYMLLRNIDVDHPLKRNTPATLDLICCWGLSTSTVMRFAPDKAASTLAKRRKVHRCLLRHKLPDKSDPEPKPPSVRLTRSQATS